MISIRTERLILRQPCLDDAPCYALGIGEYEVARFLTPVPYPYSLAMAVDWLRQARPATPQQSTLIIDLPGKGVIGCVSLLSELGFWIARPHWNKGYVTEAATALLDWHFAGCDRDVVMSSAHHDNLASLAVQKKLGFVPARREIRFSQTLQHNVDHVVTTLSRQDWQLRRRA
ncbi:GNAT family N-acetyltransferase [Devosia oryziradicis]|uniref:GNAT family N-acetyltransferase n=1 Tax=Devosia oryziradicis TaxID=2801335 RepID=A0ABX7C234_9HYPH|nr:GNAT family N-acetyltransferase [Devosia oryziradicis]QQR36730.1 GNAT family N-acetyltransferase [Devosia oryziradicis]